MERALVSGEEADDSGVLARTLETLAGLRQTPVGTVIHDQVAQLVNEHDFLRSKMDQAYALLLHLLLDAYSRDPTAEAVTRLNAELIKLRSAKPDAALAAQQMSAMADRASGVASSKSIDETDPPPQATVFSSAVSDPVLAETATQAEQLANTAYRLHLDRKRDEIEKLQETLSQSIREAISQNREFGALLQIELGAVRQANGAQELETLRQILIGGIEELINGQHLLETKLSRTGGYLNLMKADSQRLRDELHKVRLLSLTDEFTGIPNRRAFMRRLQDEIGRAQRYGTPLALALIDLDEFKGINDFYGHGGGDEVLRCYATQVLTVLRHHDMVARYGGEEFAVMLPNTTEAGAVAAIGKARKRALEAQCQFADKPITLPTFSAGVAVYGDGESAAELIERADRALYRAKSLGRNRTEVASAQPVIAPAPQAAESEPQ